MKAETIINLNKPYLFKTINFKLLWLTGIQLAKDNRKFQVVICPVSLLQARLAYYVTFSIQE